VCDPEVLGAAVVARTDTSPVVGIFGGTFDPVHNGHLQVVDAVRRQLPMDKVLFIPASAPLLRVEPLADPVHRLEMVRLAVDGWPGFEADDREIKRAGPSYTVLTLEELRQELPSQPLCLILGIDTVLRLTEWYRWTELLELAHIAVMGRPGWRLPAVLPDWWIQARIDTANDLVKCTAGWVVCVDVPLLDISSTGVRAEILQGTVSTEMLPQPVVNYIKDHALYGYHS